MTFWMTRSRLLALVAGAVLATAGTARAQSVEQFYRGRTINFLVASAPGGINDLTARLMSRHLGNHIPGRPTLVVQNLQSAGLVVANRIYAGAEKDGTTIAILERGVPRVGQRHDLLEPASDVRQIEVRAVDGEETFEIHDIFFPEEDELVYDEIVGGKEPARSSIRSWQRDTTRERLVGVRMV